ncbi:hypothetical protein DL769_010092 [Monosporascus sp. CRB-8-3]|nr:hypothetical protein DL769_010092 [Monosporascus sp. CRB-8-3]
MFERGVDRLSYRDEGHVLSSTGDEYPWYTSDICTVLDPESGAFVYTASTPGIGLVTATETGRYGFNAYGIEIRWKSDDPVSDTTTASSLAVTTSSPGSPESGQPTPGTSGIHQAGADATDPSSGNLATSEIIGIGVGVGIGSLLVVSVLVYLFLRRRRRKLPPATIGFPETAPHFEPAKLWTEPQELPAHHEPQELDSKPK